MDQGLINALQVIVVGILLGSFFGLFLLGKDNSERPFFMYLGGVVLGVLSAVSPVYSYFSNPPVFSYSFSFPWGVTYVLWVATVVFCIFGLTTWLVYERKPSVVK